VVAPQSWQVQLSRSQTFFISRTNATPFNRTGLFLGHGLHCALLNLPMAKARGFLMGLRTAHPLFEGRSSPGIQSVDGRVYIAVMHGPTATTPSPF